MQKVFFLFYGFLLIKNPVKGGQTQMQWKLV